MAKSDPTPAAKKPWEESDERKKALEAIADEETRKDADDWDRAQGVKDRLKKAREEYEKSSSPQLKNKRRGFFSE
jgi:hypothetical protein